MCCACKMEVDTSQFGDECPDCGHCHCDWYCGPLGGEHSSHVIQPQPAAPLARSQTSGSITTDTQDRLRKSQELYTPADTPPSPQAPISTTNNVQRKLREPNATTESLASEP